jgi:hypothetical protein
MFKFSIKFIVCLLLILFVNSVFAYDFDATMERIKNLQTPQEKYTELTKLIQNNHNLTQQQLMIIQQQLIIIQNMIIQSISQQTPPTSIYFTGWDKVWTWHPSFDFISVTIHPRVKIHTRPSIYAPVRGWTEHEDIFISIGDIQPGPGSIRGWGRPVSYRETKDGWINLDQLNDSKNILWCIGQYDGTVIRYYHWENGVTKFHDEAYCVDPR